MPTTTITIPYDSGSTSLAISTINLNSTSDPGMASVIATAADLESAKTDVIFLGPPVAISISANPNQIYVDDPGGSTITVNLLDINNYTTNPTDGPITISLALTSNDTGGNLKEPFSWNFPISDSEGIIEETQFSGQSSTGTATITATASEVGLPAASVTINVISAIIPENIKITASSLNVKAGDASEFSTIKATIYDSGGRIVKNYSGNIEFTISDNTSIAYFIPDNSSVPVVSGFAEIKIASATPGKAKVNIVNPDPANLTTEPLEGIVIGFYGTPSRIDLSANPTEIYGAETSAITAVIYDDSVPANIVTGIPITFTTNKGTFSNGESEITIMPSDGVAITELSSNVIGSSITATINAFSSTLTLSAIPIEVILHEKIDLFLVIDVLINYEPANKTVAFNIKVTGKDITVDEMKVSWSNNTASEKLYKITVDDSEEIFNGNRKSGDSIDINPSKDLSILIGEYTIKLTFGQDMAGRHIVVVFYPTVLGRYEIEFDVPSTP